MALRTPWFRERSKLFALSVIDACLVGGFTNIINDLRVGTATGVDTITLLLILSWTGLSYLCGRYSTSTKGNQGFLDIVTRTIVVALLVLAIGVIVFSWGLKSSDPRTYRGFLIPLLISASMASALSQQIGRRLIHRNVQPWLLISNSNDLSVLSNEQQDIRSIRRIPIQLIPLDTIDQAQQVITENDDSRCAGIAIGDLYGVPKSTIQQLADRRAAGLRVITLVNWCETFLHRVPPELISPEWQLRAEGFELRPGTLNWRTKRAGDLLLASMLGMAAIPIVAVCGALIWLEDHGPIFYRQRRNGINQTPIHIIKLRTMHVNAESGQARWAERNDPRITRTGQWLRRLRLDELPQLWNVIKGDMSLIGPRPERPEFDANLETEIPNYRLR
ncbi:MAG: exopolysaccharide biosynthesis polyprenyl glycosylphosphotransferase, partial [Cyanobacteria bacterium K_DeepCast_35m_m2_023]|nr:exopolysaccharide biosynthesis polyprenyl glycosylphosphotransferase [Cyanobacteria bacterium K_DeepCast_35m_m2_023]